MFLIFLTIFTDQKSTYGAKMLAVLKRMTFASILFFVLGLLSTGSENTAKFSKAVGLLMLAGVFLGTAGQGTISALDAFFKADWVSGDTTQGDTSSAAPAGTQQTVPGFSIVNPDSLGVKIINGAVYISDKLKNILGF